MKNYFKKFSIMFVMSLVLILGWSISAFADDSYEIGKANLNNTTNNSAKVGVALTAPEKGWKRYDDSYSKISYIGTSFHRNYMTTEYKGSNYGEYESHGDSVKFNFTGNKIRTIIPYNPLHNNSVEVYIDGIKLKTIALNYTDLRQVVAYENTELSRGEHSFELKFVGYGQGGLDAFDIDENGELLSYNESISLDKSTMNLTVGDSEQLTAITTPAAMGVKWTSSDPSIATIEVDPTNGKIIKVNALKEGTCTITATIADGSNLSASCTVNVTNKTVPVEPEPTENEYIVNTARAKGDNTNNASGEVSIIYKGVAEAQLSVVKTADVQSVFVGDNFTYTIVVTNTGVQTAKAVVINDSAPNHIDFIVSGITTTQGKVDSSSTSKNIIVNVGDIPASGTVTIKIPATVIL